MADRLRRVQIRSVDEIAISSQNTARVIKSPANVTPSAAPAYVNADMC